MGVGRETHVSSRLDAACTPKVWPAGGSRQTFSSAAIAISVEKYWHVVFTLVLSITKPSTEYCKDAWMLLENYFHSYKKFNPGQVFWGRLKLSVTRKCCVPKNNNHSTVVNQPWTTERWDRLSNPARKTSPLQFVNTYSDLPVITICLAQLYT